MTLELSRVADALPYPLGLKLQTLRAEARARAEGEGAPNLPFSIAAFNGLALRLAALIGVHAYVRAGARDNAVNQLIVDKMRAPTDGAWRDVAVQTLTQTGDDAHGARALAWLRASAQVPPQGAGWEMPPLAQADDVVRALEGGRKAPQLPKPGSRAQRKQADVEAALGDLLSFRNDLVHGIAPTDAEIDLALLRVEAIARAAAEAFGDAELVVLDGGRAWRVMGHVPQPLDAAPDGLEDQTPTLVFRDGTPPLSMSPLLRFKPSDGDGEVEVDELFFINAAAVERLHYVGFREGRAADGRALGSYEAFKSFWQRIPVTPSPRDPRLRYEELAAFHGQYFVGRGEVLDEILTSLVGGEEPGQYLELRALAGMGKTAVLSRLYAAQHPEGGAPAHTGAWAFHFCAQTEGRDYALVALRSVVAQLCDAVGARREDWLSQDLKELKDQRLPALLDRAARHHGRCVVVLDALDESVGADDEALAGCMPESLPPGVNVVLSWRVDAKNTAARVDRQLARIPASRRRALQHANPLAGLAREHVDAFLSRVHGAPPPPATRDAVWASATRDSDGGDPFFLRFVAEGVADERVDLERAETVPASLEDAFEAQWLALPREGGLIAQRALTLLGILREYADDALIAELVADDPHYLASAGATLPVHPEDVAKARQKLGKLLVYDGERYGLFHDRFRRFLVGVQVDPIAQALGEI